MAKTFASSLGLGVAVARGADPADVVEGGTDSGELPVDHREQLRRTLARDISKNRFEVWEA